MTPPNFHTRTRTPRRRRRWPASGRAAIGALVLLASASGCMRPLTRRLDSLAEQLTVTNEQLAQTNRTLLETRALLDSADRKLASMERLLASTDSGVAGTYQRLGMTNEELVGLRAQIQALLGRIPDVKPGR